MRKDLTPSLINAYDEWIETGSLSKITEVINKGKQHWLDLCIKALEVDQANIKEQQIEIQNLIESNRL